MSIPTYSETPPTVAGWYWRRDQHNEVIIRVDPRYNAGTPWRELRARTIDHCSDLTDKALLMLAPDSSWKVEWAGPIPKPQAPYL